MNFMKRLLFIAAICLLTACDSNFITTQEDLKKDSDKSQEMYAKTAQVQNKRSLVEHTDAFMVAENSFDIKDPVVLPPVFNRKIIYSSATSESFSTILADLYAQTGIKFKFTPDAIAYMNSGGSSSGGGGAAAASGGSAPPTGATGLESAAVEVGGAEVAASIGVLKNVTMNLQYEGTFKGLIERFVAGFNIYWEYEPETSTVSFFRTQTRVLALDVLPGATTFSNQMSSSSTMGGSDSGSNLNSGAVMDVNYKQLENNTWKDTVATITEMLSGEGKVTPNPRSGYIAVTDIPERLARVEDFINKINDKARRKIAVKVDVFNVELDANTDYGINWDAVIDAIGGDITLNSLANGISPLGNNTGLPIQTLSYDYTGANGLFDTAALIFGALSTVGNTSEVTGTTVYTVNGEPAPVQVVTRQDYVKEITFSAVSDQSSTTEVAVTPGTIVSGFFMVITPTILSDNQILLNLSLSLSTADVSNKESVCATGQTTNCPQITLPLVKSKNFMESVTLNAGQTVILSGFQDLDNEVGVKSVASPNFWMLGGSKATNSKKITTVTVITPYVVGR
jgi:type IVB pilus formation R64 PilN family outer membrane protein